MSAPKNLNKKMVPSHEGMVANLLSWYSLALSTPKERQDYNLNWYSIARDEIEKVAQSLGISTHTMCQVVAATSPGMSWEVNVECAKQVVIACQSYPTWEERQAHLRSVKFQVGYTWDNAMNGCAAFAGVDIPQDRKKTYSFGQCLEFPEVFGLVSPVDMHMVHMACDTKARGSIQPGKYYDPISKAITFTANLLSMDEKQFQALLWGTRVDFFKAGLSVENVYAIIHDLMERGKE